mgnify:FL=1
MQFSIFYGGGRNTKPVAKPITLSDLIKLIKHDESIKDTVKSLKELKHSGNESEYKEAKLKLPYITPYGLFSERNNQSLIEGSFNWVGAIDIDAQDQKQNWDLSKTY